MSKFKRYKVDKLVRDKILQISAEEGITTFARKLENEEYVKCLNDKLIEEAYETVKAKDKLSLLEELADLLEVLNSIAAINNIKFKKIEEARLKKKEERGGFKDKIYLHSIEMPQDHPKVAYYIARSEQYPEIK